MPFSWIVKEKMTQRQEKVYTILVGVRDRFQSPDRPQSPDRYERGMAVPLPNGRGSEKTRLRL